MISLLCIISDGVSLTNIPEMIDSTYTSTLVHSTSEGTNILLNLSFRLGKGHQTISHPDRMTCNWPTANLTDKN